MLNIAILDDYQHAALGMADWSALEARCRIQVFDRNLAVPDEAAEILAPFHILCLMRERMPLTRALIETLRAGRIAGAGLDVHHREPMAPDHPLASLDNVVLTPHLGFVADQSYRVYYEDSVEAIEAFLDGKPIRLLQP